MLAKFGALTLSDDMDEKKIQKYEREKAELQEEITRRGGSKRDRRVKGKT
jgi:hypothetical protein